MDPSVHDAGSGYSNRSRLSRLSRENPSQPPHFIVSSRLQRHHAPEVEARAVQAEQHLENIPALVSPSANFLSTSNYTTAICPLLEARHLQINQTMGPSHLPALRESDSLTHDFVNRFPFDLRHAITPQAPVHTQVRSDSVLNPAFTALSHLIPHQPIRLPKTRSSPASRTSYKQAEYITTPYTVTVPHTATTPHTATAPYIIPDLFPSISSSSSNSTNSSDLFVNPHTRLFTISNDIPPRIAEVRMYIAFMRVRFGCCITDNLIKRLINPELLAKPLLSFDDSQLETYKRHVRSWTALTTGTTIFKRLRVALEPGTYFNNERYTVPYFWFVLLVRELLIDNSYAVGSGALTRLGARCMDPCNRSFLFFSLEAAIRQLLKEIDSKSHFNSRDPTSQRKIVGKCHGDHLHIATSNQLLSNSSSPYSKPRFDKIDYQNELRARFVKLVNQCDSSSGFVAFVLINFMGLEK